MMPERMSEGLPKRMSKKYMSETLSERMPRRMSKDIMPEDMSMRMTKKFAIMSGDMSSTMSQKCANVFQIVDGILFSIFIGTLQPKLLAQLCFFARK